MAPRYDGWQYRATATDGTNSIVSREATLTLEVFTGFTVEGVTYEILDVQNKLAVTGYTGSSNTPAIPKHPINPDQPDVIYTVTEIGADAFKDKGITAITLPNSVTIIRARAFKGCTNLSTMNTSDE